MPFRNARSTVLSIAAVLLLAAASAGAGELREGETAPPFSLRDIDGRPVTLDAFRGKTVVISFWSSWCSRCEEEIAHLRDVFGGRDDAAVILVNQDSGGRAIRSRVERIRERLGVPFPMIVDEDLALWNAYGIKALPTSVVVGEDGVVLFVASNFYWSSPGPLARLEGER